MTAPIWSYLRAVNGSGAVKTAALVVTLLAAVRLEAAPRWRIQFSYQKLESSLELRDLSCPTVQRCVAAGVISYKNGRQQGIVILTNDGGKQWSQVEVKERPVSLFFLNDSAGWMVTDRGIWSTTESGRSWMKLEGTKGVVRVHFLDPSHGYAIGFPKVVYETTDGGKKWSKLAAAEQAPTDAKDTVYNCIAFSGDHGVIVGNVVPADKQSDPIWLDPDSARYRSEHQTKVAVLETFDGGKKWEAATRPIVGTLTQLKFAADGTAVFLVEYTNYFSLPSSVYRTRFARQDALTVFEERDRAITDLALFADGSAFLAGIQTPGSSNQVPIPGRLTMFSSDNQRSWVEMDSDYRAVAQRAILGAVDAQHAWVATDTGMILSLVDTPNAAR